MESIYELMRDTHYERLSSNPNREVMAGSIARCIVNNLQNIYSHAISCPLCVFQLSFFATWSNGIANPVLSRFLPNEQLRCREHARYFLDSTMNHLNDLLAAVIRFILPYSFANFILLILND